jgi:hypothetical protein
MKPDQSHRRRSWWEVVVLLAALALPALALGRAAREIAILSGLWGEAVTVGGVTSEGTRIQITAYPATSTGTPDDAQAGAQSPPAQSASTLLAR